MSKRKERVRSLNKLAIDGLRMRILLSYFIPAKCADSFDGKLGFHGCFPLKKVELLKNDNLEVLKDYVSCGRDCLKCPDGFFKVYDRESMLKLYKYCLIDDVEAKVLLSLYSRWLEHFLPLNRTLIIKATQNLFKGHVKNGAFSIDDVMQEGYIGVLDAIDKFNPNKGAFSTVAWSWIMHRVRRAGQSAVAVKIPKNNGYSVMSEISFHEFSDAEFIERNELDISPEEILLLQEEIETRGKKG